MPLIGMCFPVDHNRSTIKNIINGQYACGVYGAAIYAHFIRHTKSVHKPHYYTYAHKTI